VLLLSSEGGTVLCAVVVVGVAEPGVEDSLRTRVPASTLLVVGVRGAGDDMSLDTMGWSSVPLGSLDDAEGRSLAVILGVTGVAEDCPADVIALSSGLCGVGDDIAVLSC